MVLVAKGAHLLPIFGGSHAVVEEVPVVVGLGDQRRHVALALVVGRSYGLQSNQGTTTLCATSSGRMPG